MLLLIIIIACLAAAVILFLCLGKRALTPEDTYLDPHSPSFAPLMRCRHCEAVITSRNVKEHGVNCPKKAGNA
jgi:hypothetical protein